MPQKDTYFMLAQKGGHNPNLVRLEDKESDGLSSAENKLFYLALTHDAEKLGIESIISEVNRSTDFNWILLNNKDKDNRVFDDETNGINLIQDFIPPF
mgnify:CR=1 FL=1